MSIRASNMFPLPRVSEARVEVGGQKTGRLRPNAIVDRFHAGRPIHHPYAQDAHFLEARRAISARFNGSHELSPLRFNDRAIQQRLTRFQLRSPHGHRPRCPDERFEDFGLGE